MRLYEMFMGPLERMKPWSTSGLEGQSRFLKKVWRAILGDDDEPHRINDDKPPLPLLKIAHQTIKKVTEDIDNLRFNTAIAQLMIFSNEMGKQTKCYREVAEIMVKLLAPFTPHFAEELWQLMGHKDSITFEPWPVYEEAMAKEDSITVVFQSNGKVRAQAEVSKGLGKDELESMARNHENIIRHTKDCTIIKVIVVPDKLVNIVVKPK